MSTSTSLLGIVVAIATPLATMLELGSGGGPYNCRRMALGPRASAGGRSSRRYRGCRCRRLVDTGGGGGHHVSLKSDDGRRRHWGLVVMVCCHWWWPLLSWSWSWSLVVHRRHRWRLSWLLVAGSVERWYVPDGGRRCCGHRVEGNWTCENFGECCHNTPKSFQVQTKFKCKQDPRNPNVRLVDRAAAT